MIFIHIKKKSDSTVKKYKYIISVRRIHVQPHVPQSLHKQNLRMRWSSLSKVLTSGGSRFRRWCFQMWGMKVVGNMAHIVWENNGRGRGDSNEINGMVKWCMKAHSNKNLTDSRRPASLVPPGRFAKSKIHADLISVVRQISVEAELPKQSHIRQSQNTGRPNLPRLNPCHPYLCRSRSNSWQILTSMNVLPAGGRAEMINKKERQAPMSHSKHAEHHWQRCSPRDVNVSVPVQHTTNNNKGNIFASKWIKEMFKQGLPNRLSWIFIAPSCSFSFVAWKFV